MFKPGQWRISLDSKLIYFIYKVVEDSIKAIIFREKLPNKWYSHVYSLGMAETYLERHTKNIEQPPEKALRSIIEFIFANDYVGKWFIARNIA